MPRLKYYNAKTEAWEPADSVFGTGNVKTVNGVVPDVNGNIEVTIPEMPEISYPVTSVNGMTGDVVIEIPKVEISEIHEQVQADWNQNDPTQPDYVKNRTHWEESGQTVIEWDGNTEGRVEFNRYYKVSNLTPSISEAVGGKMIFPGEGEYEITTESISDDTASYGIYEIMGATMVVLTVVEDAPETLETGVYFRDDNPIGTSLVCNATTIHQLDEKYIPDSIARTEQLKDEIFVVTVNIDYESAAEEEIEVHDTYVISTNCYQCITDRTLDEIDAAYNAGKIIIARYGESYDINGITIHHYNYIPLTEGRSTDSYVFHTKTGNTGNTDIEVSISSSGCYYYLNTIDFFSLVPEPTEDNNGAFLRVVDGAYALVNLTDVSTEGA